MDTGTCLKLFAHNDYGELYIPHYTNAVRHDFFFVQVHHELTAIVVSSNMRAVQPGGRRLLHQRLAGQQGAHLERAGEAGRGLERPQRHGHRGVLHPRWPGAA
jgi:hypothetical protein